MNERFMKLSQRVMPFMWQEIDEGIKPALYAATSPQAARRCVLRPARALRGGWRRRAGSEDPNSRQGRGRRPPVMGDLRTAHRSEVSEAELSVTPGG